MHGCLIRIINHLLWCVVLSILCNSFVVGGIFFFLPFVYVIVYFIIHKKEGKIVLKNLLPIFLFVGMFLIGSLFAYCYNNYHKRKDEIRRIYYNTHYVELDLAECVIQLPSERELEKSFYTNAKDEMSGMDGKTIIGNFEYGMSPREVYNEGDSLEYSQCAEISVGKIQPKSKCYGMFNSEKQLYGIQIEYKMAWEGFDGLDEIESDLKEVIGILSNRYGEPILDFRNDKGYHVKWNKESQVVHWYSEIKENYIESELYIYLPWAYLDAFK